MLKKLLCNITVYRFAHAVTFHDTLQCIVILVSQACGLTYTESNNGFIVYQCHSFPGCTVFEPLVTVKCEICPTGKKIYLHLLQLCYGDHAHGFIQEKITHRH